MTSKRDIYLEVDLENKLIIASGNTYDFQSVFRSQQGKWSAADKCWKVPYQSEEQYKNIGRVIKVRHFLKTVVTRPVDDGRKKKANVWIQE